MFIGFIYIHSISFCRFTSHLVPGNKLSRLALVSFNHITLWQQLIFADSTLILEHSFFLHQQNVQDPIATAAEAYKSSGMSARVAKALTEIFPQFNPHEKEREKMCELIMNVISQHVIGKPQKCLVFFSEHLIAKNVSKWSNVFIEDPEYLVGWEATNMMYIVNQVAKRKTVI